MQSLDEGLIGMCIKSERGLLEAMGVGVKAEHFADPALGKIWIAMAKLAAEEKPIDLVSLSCALPDETTRLVDLVTESSSPDVRNVEAYGSALVNQARDRDIYRALQRAQREIEAKQKRDAFARADATDRVLDEVFVMAMQTALHASTKDGLAVVKQLEERWEWEHTNGERFSVVPTGFASIDRQLNGGMTKGAVMTVAARTGQGKSMLAANIALRAALAGSRVLYVTIEMDAMEIVERMIADYGTAPYSRVIRAGRTPQEYDAHAKLARALKDGMLSICDDSDGRIAEVERIVRYAKMTRPYDLVIVDYIQQFHPPTRGNERMIDRVREVSNFIKMGIAKKHGVAVMNIAQMNRNAEAEGKGGMRLGNIKESGSIENDSDIVAFIEHEDPAEPSPEAVASGLDVDGLCWFNIRKQRKNLRNIGVPLRFVGKYSRFEEVGDVHFAES